MQGTFLGPQYTNDEIHKNLLNLGAILILNQKKF